jgi:hypothetical protein
VVLLKDEDCLLGGGLGLPLTSLTRLGATLMGAEVVRDSSWALEVELELDSDAVDTVSPVLLVVVVVDRLDPEGFFAKTWDSVSSCFLFLLSVVSLLTCL